MHAGPVGSVALGGGASRRGAGEFTVVRTGQLLGACIEQQAGKGGGQVKLSSRAIKTGLSVLPRTQDLSRRHCSWFCCCSRQGSNRDLLNH